jgi:lipid II:glycine glycyltransferase (peptidoglycan interpeptide bridge formation enzyme)
MSNFQKIENKAELQKLLDKALFKTFFHSFEWQEFLENEFKWLKFEHYLYKDEMLFTLAKVGSKLISLPFCEYGGPLPLKENFDFANFERDVLEEFENIKIKFHPQIKTGNSDSEVSTHWVEDLKKINADELFASFRKTLRHSIKNAENQGLEIKKCLNLKELKQFYNLYLINLKRKKTVPYPFSIFEFLFNSPNVEILLAFYKGKIIAGDLFIHYGKFVHYLFSAADYKYRNSGPSYLILWEKLKSLCGQDKIFDLGAAPRNSELEIFKKGWRGKEYPILQIGIKRSEESLRSSKLRIIWGLLPGFIIRKFSPFLIKYRL